MGKFLRHPENGVSWFHQQHAHDFVYFFFFKHSGKLLKPIRNGQKLVPAPPRKGVKFTHKLWVNLIRRLVNTKFSSDPAEASYAHRQQRNAAPRWEAP